MSPTHLAHVLTKDVDWTLLPSTVPTSVAQLLKRCLTRDPRERLRDIGEARIALQAPVSDSPAEARSGEAPAIVPVWHRLVPLAGALLLGVVGAGLYFGGATTSPTASAEPTRFRLQMPDGVFSLFGEVALSPDGRTYVFRGGSDANGVSQLYRPRPGCPRRRTDSRHPSRGAAVLRAGRRLIGVLRPVGGIGDWPRAQAGLVRRSSDGDGVRAPGSQVGRRLGARWVDRFQRGG